ncbi:hypothetical protein [Sphingomonas daechungensis]|uniref:hypothetical protein n=1 Tax=Sphingomonas daechungensis TaxID=1176646 RepID=UPI003783E2F5
MRKLDWPLACSSTFIGTRIAGPPTITLASANAGAWPQLTMPPTAPSRPIEATCTDLPSLNSTTSEIIVVPKGK